MRERHFYQYTFPETHGHTNPEPSRFRYHPIEAKGGGRAIRRDRSPSGQGVVESSRAEERYMVHQRHARHLLRLGGYKRGTSGGAEG